VLAKVGNEPGVVESYSNLPRVRIFLSALIVLGAIAH
jgi:hypothetical protein